MHIRNFNIYLNLPELYKCVCVYVSIYVSVCVCVGSITCLTTTEAALFGSILPSKSITVIKQLPRQHNQ